MANELNYYGNLNETGLTVIAKIFNSNGSQFGADINCVENGLSAIYVGNMLQTAPFGQYGIRFFNGNILLGQGIINWDGQNEIELNSPINNNKTSTFTFK